MPSCAQDLKTWSAAKKHTNVERGGSRDPGVRRPGAGRGQLPPRSKIFRVILSSVFDWTNFFSSVIPRVPVCQVSFLPVNHNYHKTTLNHMVPYGW